MNATLFHPLNLRGLLFSPLLAAFAIGAAGSTAVAQTTHLYTASHADAQGGISGHVDQEVTHALALEHDRVSCYKADLSDGGKGFRFSGLPIGKYDLIFVTRSGTVYEGVLLGEEPKLTGVSMKGLQDRVVKADTFFNKAKIQRFGSINNGETIIAFVERGRDKQILKQSGEVLNSNLRRLEVMDLERATDDWQMMTTRHIYREEATIGAGMDFFKHKYVPELGNVRVIDSVKDLGVVTLPPAS